MASTARERSSGSSRRMTRVRATLIARELPATAPTAIAATA
eukprot:CAMPEP_0180194396 /NCGR_PEP_ID=MMETSP0987-20121128/3022_1 /TAXON_ID=697907 /ORGANISM="non described non described, Strain CCMP2293" /LENGTH=40 /DNA_ID= /DNA_START= /DNA_END= /DNA_ORIENTATION=